MTTDHTTDVLIVGSGIMGAATAALLREELPAVHITMVDGGALIGNEPGTHLRDSTEPAIWQLYNQKVASGIQGLYAGDEQLVPTATMLEQLDPGLHRIGTLGEDGTDMPGAALAWNVGGMGVHWTAATPWPAGSERFGAAGRWEEDLATARRLLNVTASPIGPTAVGELVLAAVNNRFADVLDAGREAQPMPMATELVDGRLYRTGPARIFPPIGGAEDGAFALLPQTLAVALLHSGEPGGEHTDGALVRDLATGEEYVISASVVVVCGDAMRTPQLLFASGIRPPALGRFLNEHAFVSNRVLLDLDRFGLSLDDLPRALPDEFATDSLWLPQSEAQPYQVQIMNRTYRDDGDAPLGYGVGLSVYVATEIQEANRLVFDEQYTDLMGMPRIHVQFSYSDHDTAMIEGVTDFVGAIASDLGDWDPQTESKVLPAGSSLHYTGTVRSGPVDDGTSVCDPSGRVWGFGNLYVAGNGVIPTALSCNSTLTGVVTVVRAVESIVEQLSAGAGAAVSSYSASEAQQ